MTHTPSTEKLDALKAELKQAEHELAKAKHRVGALRDKVVHMLLTLDRQGVSYL